MYLFYPTQKFGIFPLLLRIKLNSNSNNINGEKGPILEEKLEPKAWGGKRV